MAVKWRQFPMLENLPELVELERLIQKSSDCARIEEVGRVSQGKLSFPLYTITLGSQDPEAPVLGLFGGVHGLERIGTQVLLSYLKTVTELVRWDHLLQELLKHTRIVFMPLVNPAGMYLKQRSNANGVDLMRNSPIRADKIPPYFIYAGHRISPKLPWYQGKTGEPMEVEAQSLCDVVRRSMFSSKIALAVDVHSGFGTVDRLWFPYAKTNKPFPNLAEVFALKTLLDRTYPNHVYRVEPQAKQYTAHGDLWDFLYDEHRQQERKGLFIPLTIELGSWIWLKKNKLQIFNILGAFNPLSPHRVQRTLRRHTMLLDFLHRAVQSPGPWAHLNEVEKRTVKRRAMELWYAR